MITFKGSEQVYPYLTFNGNCREAMEFYRSCLGGKLDLQQVKDSPLSSEMPETMQSRILHANLQLGQAAIMGSDMTPESGLQKGNSVSIVFYCRSEAEIRELYTLLSEGGSATHPVEQTFWGASFGGLTDRFGHHWLLHYHAKNP